MVLFGTMLSVAFGASIAERVAAMRESSRTGEMNHRLIRELGDLGDEAVPELAKYIDDPDMRMRQHVVMALAGTNSKKAIPFLAHALDQPQGDQIGRHIRWAAAGGMAQLGDPGLKAFLVALKDPDSHFRSEVTGSLRSFMHPHFPPRSGNAKRLGPMKATIDNGLVIGPKGLIEPPYTIHASVVPKGDRFLYTLKANDVILVQYDRRAERKYDLDETADRTFNSVIRDLVADKCVVICQGFSTKADSALFVRRVIEIITEAGKTPFERACWLRALPWFGSNRPVAEHQALGPKATADEVSTLAARVEQQSPRFEFYNWDRGIRLTARNVPLDYCLRKFRLNFGVLITADPGVHKHIDLAIVADFHTQDEFLPAFADQVCAKLSKRDVTYHLSPATVKKLDDPLPWEAVWSASGEKPYGVQPVYADGIVVCELDYGRWSAYQLRDGRPVWQRKLLHQGRPPKIVDGLIYAGGTMNQMFAVRLGDGKTLWRYDVPYPQNEGLRQCHEPALLGVEEHMAVYASSDGNIYGIHRSNGVKLWTHRPAVGTPWFLIDGIIYCAGPEGSSAIDVKTRKKVWSKPHFPRGRPLWADGVIYASGDGRIWAYSAKDGGLLWKTATGRKGRMARQPVLAEGTLIVCGDTNDTSAYGLDPATGTVRWRTLLSKGAYNAVAIGSGRALIVGRGKHLYTLRISDGTVLADRPLYVPGRCVPVVTSDLILVPAVVPDKGANGGRKAVLTAYRPLARKPK